MNREPIEIHIYKHKERTQPLRIQEHRDFSAVDMYSGNKVINITHSSRHTKLANMKELIEALLVIYKQWEEDSKS